MTYRWYSEEKSRQGRIRIYRQQQPLIRADQQHPTWRTRLGDAALEAAFANPGHRRQLVL